LADLQTRRHGQETQIVPAPMAGDSKCVGPAGGRESLFILRPTPTDATIEPQSQNSPRKLCSRKTPAMDAGHSPPMNGLAVLLTTNSGPQDPESCVAIIRYPTVFPDNYRTSTGNVFVEHKGCRVNLRWWSEKQKYRTARHW